MSDLKRRTNGEIDFTIFVAIFWSHKFTIAIITAVSIVFSVYYFSSITKLYTATSVFRSAKEGIDLNISSELRPFASLAGIGGTGLSNVDNLIERIQSREFILQVNQELSLEGDPLFYSYSPQKTTDPLWISTIKRLLNWQSIELDEATIKSASIVNSYKEYVKFDTTPAGAISLSVTHTDPVIAAKYANSLMLKTQQLTKAENEKTQEQKLSYLSETLADAIQEMEQAQQKLKEYVLNNSALAEENFITGSLKLDELRIEQRNAQDISEVLTVLDQLIKTGDLDSKDYEALRISYPIIDDVNFRRIMGMSETISAWTWPDIETNQAVRATLRDRIKRLDIEIKNIEDNAKVYATSAEDLAKFTRDANIADATYKVLIEQVKSQSLSAGFKPETFTIFEYATPPLGPSSPNGKRIVILGALFGLFTGFVIALLNSLRTGVYYTYSSLKTDADPKISLRSDRMRRLSRLTSSKILSRLAKKRISQIDEAEVMLADENIVLVQNLGGRISSWGMTRLLATQSSVSGRKVIVCDMTGHLTPEKSQKFSKKISGLEIFSSEANFDIFDGFDFENGRSFFKSVNFKNQINDLLSSYDQVYICSSQNDSIAALIALKNFKTNLVLLARLKKTRKSHLQKVKAFQNIGVLIYD